MMEPDPKKFERALRELSRDSLRLQGAGPAGEAVAVAVEDLRLMINALFGEYLDEAALNVSEALVALSDDVRDTQLGSAAEYLERAQALLDRITG